MARDVVVGAGVGGLAAAARLAAGGHAVTVLERAPTVGGKLGVVEADGFRFDTGPSLLTLPQTLAELFAATGAPLEAALDLQPVEPIARTRFADGTWITSSRDLDAVCAQLDAALHPGAGDEWRALMDRARRMWEAAEGPFLRSPLTIADLVRLSVRVRRLAAVAPWATLRGLGRRYLRDPRLRMVLERCATYTGSDPRRAPAALASIAYVEQTFGGWYVRGGLRRLGDAIAERAIEQGARIRCDAEVVEIDVLAGRAVGVRLADGERLPADVVVANADAASVYGRLLPRRLTRTARARLAAATPSLSGFVLLLGVRNDGRRIAPAHHTVLFPADYDAEFDAIFRRARPAPDPTLYVAAPDDPSVAPAGHEAWFVLVNAPRHGAAAAGGALGRRVVDWQAGDLARRYGDHLLDLLARRGLDVRGRVVHRSTISPAHLARRTGAPGGAIYGTSSNGPLAAFLRPANRAPVPGLYLVGGSAHPGGGLPLVVLSAKIVADLVGPA